MSIHFTDPQIKPVQWAGPEVLEARVWRAHRAEGLPQPVLRLPFWEGAGPKALDLSGFGNDGTWNGTGTHWGGGVAKLNGTDDYIDLGTGILVGAIAFSILIRVFISNTEFNGTWKSIISDEDNPASNNGFQYIFDDRETGTRPENGLNSAIDNDSVNLSVTENAIGVAWEWYDLGLVYNDPSLKIYVNGREVSSYSTQDEGGGLAHG